MTAIGLQLVGLNSKPGRSTVTWSCLSWTGTPLTNCGSGSLVTVTAAVSGLTLIRERTLTSPRLNGPATAGVCTNRPNGAPRSRSSVDAARQARTGSRTQTRPGGRMADQAFRAARPFLLRPAVPGTA